MSALPKSPELQALQQELARRCQDYERLFNAVPCYITVQDRDHRIVESNELFERDFGARAGAHCYLAYKGRASVCPDCPVQETFTDGAVHQSEEAVVTCHGRRVNLMVQSTPIRDDDGVIRAVMEVSTDVTEVKRLQSLATVGIAVSGMAHRIKNILMGLKGGIYVVDTGFEQDDRPTVDQGWNMVVRNVDKVAKVVADLLFCSKDRRPALTPGVAPCEILREVYDLYRDRAAADGIELRLELDGPRRGTFDPEALFSLVVNLVANAIDACRFDPAIDRKQHEIGLCCHPGTSGGTVIEVRDNGAGIPDALKERVFEGFFSTKGTEGTGLGLLVVQKVAEEHHGEISLESREGEGTTIKVAFPPSASGAGAQNEEVSDV